MEQRKRRTFTPEHKAEVVRFVRTSGKSIGQLAGELELTETAVRAWVKQAEIDEKKDPNGPLTSDALEVTRLRRELRTMTMEKGLPPKSCGLLRQERKMSFELIAAEAAHYPKALMCRALGLSRSGHHSYRTRGPSRHAIGQQKLDLMVAAIFNELKGRYGAPRVERELRLRGHCASKKCTFILVLTERATCDGGSPGILPEGAAGDESLHHEHDTSQHPIGGGATRGGIPAARAGRHQLFTECARIRRGSRHPCQRGRRQVVLQSRQGIAGSPKPLRGSGTQTRWTPLDDASVLARPQVARLVDEAIAGNRVPFARTGRGPVVIRSDAGKPRQ